MRYMRLTLALALLIFFTCPKDTDAQIRDPILGTRTAITTAPDTTILALTHRIEALEALVAALQQKTAFIKSVNPLVLDPGADVTILGGQISLEARTTMNLRGGTNTEIRAGNQLLVNSSGPLDVRGGSGLTLRSGSSLLVEAGSMLDLKGSMVRHNGGTAPVACAVTNAVVACSGTVGVPPPGQ